MTIQGPLLAYGAEPTTRTTASVPAPSLPPGQSIAPASSIRPAARTTLSPPGMLLSKLEQLKQSDPVLFKQTVEKLAQTAQTAADKAAPDSKADATKLAEQLSNVAKTGDVSVFKTPKHHHHHAQPHPSGGTGALLSSLLDEVDLVLGPSAPSALSTST